MFNNIYYKCILPITCYCRADNKQATEGILGVWKGYGKIEIERFDVFSGIPVDCVSLGKLHCAFLTKYGQLFTLGNNQCGQLGHGDTLHVIDEPKYVQDLKGRETILKNCKAAFVLCH